jgi:hypothetical protein
VLSTQFKSEAYTAPDCLYCREPLEKDLVITKCAHIFHTECKDALVAIAQWSQTCPYCKQANPWGKGAIIKPAVDSPALHRAIDKIEAVKVRKFLNGCEKIKNNVNKDKNIKKLKEFVFDSSKPENINDWYEFSKSIRAAQDKWYGLSWVLQFHINIEVDVFKNSKGLTIQKADELPKLCNELAAELDRFEPQFTSRCSLYEFKVMELHKDDAAICKVFNENVFKILKEKSPVLSYSEGLRPSAMGFHYDCDKDIASFFERLKTGLFLYSDRNVFKCSVNELEAAYEEILLKMQTGWVAASLVHYNDIYNKKDLDQFFLYIKKDQFLSQEVYLINAILKKLSLFGKAECDNFSYSFTLSGPPFLWIKKTALSEVIEKLGIKQ